MSKRGWLYNELCSFPGLMGLIGDGVDPANSRVYAKKTMTSSVEDHPFIIYKFGYNASEDISEDPEFIDPERQFLQIWAHDYSDGNGNADYTRIDQVLAQVKLAINKRTVPEEGIYLVRYLETSQDLDDDTLNTVFRYARYQFVQEGEG